MKTPDIDQIMTDEFSPTRRDPVSAEYKQGARAALHFRFRGTHIINPYRPGTARRDAFFAGSTEGHRIFRLHGRRTY